MHVVRRCGVYDVTQLVYDTSLFIRMSINDIQNAIFSEGDPYSCSREYPFIRLMLSSILINVKK